MNANRLVWIFLLLLPLANQGAPQQSEADRRLLANLRAHAGSGEAEAQYLLGGAFEFGSLGAEKDYVQAVEWYRKAAEQNHAGAQFVLGSCCARGLGLKQDEVEAAKWYRKAAE